MPQMQYPEALTEFLPPELVEADESVVRNMLNNVRSEGVMPDEGRVLSTYNRFKDRDPEYLIHHLREEKVSLTQLVGIVDLTVGTRATQEVLEYLWMQRYPDFLRAYVAQAITDVDPSQLMRVARDPLLPNNPTAARFSGELGSMRVEYIGGHTTIAQTLKKLGVEPRTAVQIWCQRNLQPAQAIENVSTVIQVPEGNPQMYRFKIEHKNCQPQYAEALLVRADAMLRPE